MHQIDVADDTFIRAPHASVVAAVHERDRWARWWPDLTLTATTDRGPKGLRWLVGGAVRGSMELWTQDVPHGCVIHYFLRVDLPQRHPSPRRIERVRERRRVTFRADMWMLKDELETSPYVLPITPVVS